MISDHLKFILSYFFNIILKFFTPSLDKNGLSNYRETKNFKIF